MTNKEARAELQARYDYIETAKKDFFDLEYSKEALKMGIQALEMVEKLEKALNEMEYKR